MWPGELRNHCGGGKQGRLEFIQPGKYGLIRRSGCVIICRRAVEWCGRERARAGWLSPQDAKTLANVSVGLSRAKLSCARLKHSTLDVPARRQAARVIGPAQCLACHLSWARWPRDEEENAVGDAGNCEEDDSSSGKSGDLEHMAEARGSVNVLSVADSVLRHLGEQRCAIVERPKGNRREIHS
jgi:hypothetical protein